MNKSLQEYTSDFLPRDTAYTVQKLKEHSESFQSIEDLFSYTVNNGHDVLQSIREYHSVEVKAVKIDEFLSSDQKSSSDWQEIWTVNQKHLDETLQILQLLQGISQVYRLSPIKQKVGINIKNSFVLISRIFYVELFSAFSNLYIPF